MTEWTTITQQNKFIKLREFDINQQESDNTWFSWEIVINTDKIIKIFENDGERLNEPKLYYSIQMENSSSLIDIMPEEYKKLCKMLWISEDE